MEMTKLEGVYLLEPTVYSDSRGYFFESFNDRKFEELTGFPAQFVQDNQSKSTRGVLRGLHYQLQLHGSTDAYFANMSRGKLIAFTNPLG